MIGSILYTNRIIKKSEESLNLEPKFISFVNSFIYYTQTAHELKKVQKELDEVEWQKFKQEELHKITNSPRTSPRGIKGFFKPSALTVTEPMLKLKFQMKKRVE